MRVAQGRADEREPDDELDHDGLYALARTIALRSVDASQIRDLIRQHWADFGLLDEHRHDHLADKYVDGRAGKVDIAKAIELFDKACPGMPSACTRANELRSQHQAIP